MKKIINGKMYNTETAKMVGSWSNNVSCSDFSYCEEELYKKKTGEFFLYGSGGAMSKYATSCGNGWTGGGQAITPMTVENAKRWMERHCDADEYIEVFGEVEE